jgi:purine-cytosine permease-like protein
LSTIDPSLSNRDLAPTTLAQRTWTTYNYIALWFSMSMEITTYKLASSLIAKGMDWKQALGTVLLGNLIVLIPMLLNAHAGTKYGIPFPVFIRAPFGVRPLFCARLWLADGLGFNRGSEGRLSIPCCSSSGLPLWATTASYGLAFSASGC